MHYRYIPFALFLYFIMALNIATLNINGLNNEKKEMKLNSLANFHKLDVVMLQEHNIKNQKSLDNLSQFYEIFIN